MADWNRLAARAESPILGKRIEKREILARVCVRPPYFTFENLWLEGVALRAETSAELPAFLERGPMTASELGRHAAIAGLCRAALAQPDAARRYYLARRASCRYQASSVPFGSPITFEANLLALDKRHAQALIDAYADERLLASFTVSYAVLNEPTFERLFSARRQAHVSPDAPSPYGRLLCEAIGRGPNWAEQRFTVPAYACAGHFENYPALPVAVLMGQLSYLAGQLVPAGRHYRVREGQIEAEDLCWAGEDITLRAELLKTVGREQTFLCTGRVGEREVGRMVLKIEGGQAYAGVN